MSTKINTLYTPVTGFDNDALLKQVNSVKIDALEPSNYSYAGLGDSAMTTKYWGLDKTGIDGLSDIASGTGSPAIDSIIQGPTVSAANTMDTTGINPLDTTSSETPGVMDWLNDNSKGIGTGIQAIGLGASLYDTFFGDTAEINDKNMQIMDQQIASNADTMANTKAVRAAWANTEKVS